MRERKHCSSLIAKRCATDIATTSVYINTIAHRQQTHVGKMTNSTNFIGKQELGNAVERVKIYRPTQLICIWIWTNTKCTVGPSASEVVATVPKLTQPPAHRLKMCQQSNQSNFTKTELFAHLSDFFAQILSPLEITLSHFSPKQVAMSRYDQVGGGGFEAGVQTMTRLGLGKWLPHRLYCPQ